MSWCARSRCQLSNHGLSDQYQPNGKHRRVDLRTRFLPEALAEQSRRPGLLNWRLGRGFTGCFQFGQRLLAHPPDDKEPLRDEVVVKLSVVAFRKPGSRDMGMNCFQLSYRGSLLNLRAEIVYGARH